MVKQNKTENVTCATQLFQEPCGHFITVMMVFRNLIIIVDDD